MNKNNKTLTNMARAMGIAAILAGAQLAHGGWSGAMNGTGFGWAGVNVVSSQLKTNNIRTGNILRPSAAMAPALGYYTNSALPSGSSPNTVAQIKGAAGYVWQANTSGANGDKTDNFELENRVLIRSANCPTLTLESALTPDSFDGKTGSITVKSFGSAGTALWLRGFEVSDWTVVPTDDPSTLNNETTDYLKAHGVLKFENLMVGPFEYGSGGKCELIVYFTIDGESLDNLIVTADGVAKSNPISLACPPPQTVNCGQLYQYPDVTSTGGCGNVTVKFEPPVEDLHFGVNTITVTASDEAGDQGSCTFTVNVIDTTAPVPDAVSLPTVKGQCSATIAAVPTATDSCAGKIKGSTLDPLTYTQHGVYTVIWKYNDGNGNVSMQTQTVEVQDTIPPTPDCSSVLTGSSRVITLKATDNCDPNPKIYLKDSVTSYTAGPFKNNDKIIFRQNPTQAPYSQAATGVYVSRVQFKNAPLIWAEDSNGNKSTPIPCQ